MALLEELKPGVLIKGLLPGNLVTVVDVKRQGSICVELTYKDANGHVTLEIEAKIPDGVIESTVRTILENCAALKFKNPAFEEE